MRKVVVLALSLVGLFDSSFLWWMYASPSRPMVCTGSGCDAVRASSYAHVAGVPLPIFGVAMYALLALLIFVEPLSGERAARWMGYGVGAITGAGFLFSVYLTGIEAFVLHNWCEWCVVSAITVTLMFILSLWELARPSSSGGGQQALASLRKYVTVIMIAILVGIPSFIVLSHADALAPAPQASKAALQEHLVRPDSHTYGNPNSPVTMVEFGDFQCPFCGQSEKVVRKIRATYKDDVRFVFRQYPIPQLHINAENSAEASECAGEQGKFWEMFDKLYNNQEDLSLPALKQYASELGLDVGRFDQCLTSGAMAARVAQDKADGAAIGVTSTPTYFVDAQKIVGGMEYNKFAELLDKDLASHGISPPAGETGSAALSAGTGLGHPQSKGEGQAHPSASSATGPGPSMAGSGLLGPGAGGNIFAPGGSSLAGCSEAEASQQQAALINTTQANQMFKGGAKTLFVDVRSHTDYDKARIEGAINVPLHEFENRWHELPKDRNIVLYESGGNTSSSDICASGRAAGRFLLAHGYSSDHVKVYYDGLRAWEKAGLPVERGTRAGS